jgi:hypothetical protein
LYNHELDLEAVAPRRDGGSVWDEPRLLRHEGAGEVSAWDEQGFSATDGLSVWDEQAANRSCVSLYMCPPFVVGVLCLSFVLMFVIKGE